MKWLASLALLICSTCLGQVEVSHDQGTLSPASAVWKLDSGATVATDISDADSKPCVVVRLMRTGPKVTDKATVSVRASNINRVPVPVYRASDLSHVITAPGRSWVEITVIDFTTQFFFQPQPFVVELGDGPDPPDPPEPPDPPTPPGPFDNIAQRVAAIATKLTQAERDQLTGIFGTVADKIDSGEFRILDQQKQYIDRNWPRPVSADSAALFVLLKDDFNERIPTMGVSEQMSYYREFAKGCK